MTSKPTPATPPQPALKRSFSIFQDDARLPSANFGTASNENLEPSHVSKFDNEPAVTDGPGSSANRVPLVDVTEEVVGRSRSLSSALAEIAKLEDKLEALKDKNRALKSKNRKLKGEIVAYQDALYQADKDAGYL